MPHLFLVRHGQSEWNLEKRFTGWVDIDLTGKGKLEACKSGEYIKEQNLKIDYFFSSLQLRAINTLKLIQDTLRAKNKPIKAWQFFTKFIKFSNSLSSIKCFQRFSY